MEWESTVPLVKESTYAYELCAPNPEVIEAPIFLQPDTSICYSAVQFDERRSRQRKQEHAVIPSE